MNHNLAKTFHLLLLTACAGWFAWSSFLIITIGDPEFGSCTDHFFTAWPLLIVQPLYPILHLATTQVPWTKPWRFARVLHLSLVLLVVLAFGLLVLATPDVSGFKN